MRKNYILIFYSFFLFPLGLLAQPADSLDLNRSPYDLMSNYYMENFQPFAKKNIYMGLAFSVSDRQMTNANYLLQKVLDGQRLGFDISLRGGYYTGNYGMLGAAVNYNQTEFNGLVLKDTDTIQSSSMTRGYSFTPYFRSSVPLTANERLSFYTQIGLTFGNTTTLTRSEKTIDDISKSYSEAFHFRVGLSPGITFFAMENFAFEVQLNLLGYDLTITDKTVDGVDESRVIRQNVDFEIDLFSLDLGLAYYFGNGTRNKNKKTR